MDQTDLTVPDHYRRKDFGRIGDSHSFSRGLHLIDAIATTLDGCPLGMCAQVYWVRPDQPVRPPPKNRRPLGERETTHWLEAMQQVRTAFDDAGVISRPWFQVDRGGDAWPLFIDAKLAETSWLTVRANHNRRLDGKLDQKPDSLWSRFEREAVLGTYDLDVPAQRGFRRERAARRATLALQASPVTLDIELRPSTERIGVGMWAVRVFEMNPPSDGEEPLDWMLLTTFPIENPLQDAMTVVRAYTTRWRIEELHKVWKSGACRVEESQLADRDHLERWATLSASVAVRLLRLLHLSRHQPQLPATEEFSRPEIDAAILLAKPRKTKRGATPTIAELVRWIADLGGYTGNSSGGPPGALVIARGLQQIRPVAQILLDGEM